MGYCAQSDIEDVLTGDEIVQCADYDGDGIADSDVIARAIDWADRKIDSYLGARYEIPLSSTPDVVKNCSVSITIYRLYANRRSVSEDTRDEYKDWIKWLEDVAAGKISLGLSDPPDESPGAGGVRYSGDDRHFGRDKAL